MKYWCEAVLVTLIVGVFVSLMGANLQWPELGSIAAVATMGGFILYAMEK